MKYLTILLVLATELGAAESDTPKPVPTPPAPPAAVPPVAGPLVTDSPAAAATATTPAIPIKPACCCEASGGRAGFLARSLATTPTAVVSPSPVAPPSH